MIDGFRWCLLGGESQLYLPGFLASLGVVAFFLWLGIALFPPDRAHLRGSDLNAHDADVVIRAEGLGKKYLIGHRGASASATSTLRDVIGAHGAELRPLGARHVARPASSSRATTIEEFWALKDVNFEVKRGEVVGIIGRNGAGKSTLLKILVAHHRADRGPRRRSTGRVGSLLEVGTGFHPELTGRENIYLNGAILGMSARRDQTQVRRDRRLRRGREVPRHAGEALFVSGMYVRLAFAVAAHLEPEILIVDEVLAVGDAEFQKKCLGKMQDVAGHGRTVLFVSHNMPADQSPVPALSLCSTAGGSTRMARRNA